MKRVEYDANTYPIEEQKACLLDWIGSCGSLYESLKEEDSTDYYTILRDSGPIKVLYERALKLYEEFEELQSQLYKHLDEE
jgi:hypothetical protein